MARRPTRDPYARPAIQTLERLHAELGGKILENRQEHANLAEKMRHVESVKYDDVAKITAKPVVSLAGSPASNPFARTVAASTLTIAAASRVHPAFAARAARRQWSWREWRWRKSSGVDEFRCERDK
jgi:hypothetical protein